MVSLLLTLFVSLFSVCPAFNKVDQVENNVVLDNQNHEKRSFDYNGMNNLFSIYEVINQYTFSNYYYENTNWWRDSTRPVNDYIIYRSAELNDPNLESAYLCPSYSDIDFEYLGLPTTYYQFNEIRIYYRGTSYVYQDDINEEYVYQSYYELYFYYGSNQIINNAIGFYYLTGTNFSGRFMTYQGNYGNWNNWCVLTYNSNGYYWSNLFSVNSNSGYNQGYTDGYASGSTSGYSNGYQIGYNDGIAYMQEHNSTAVTIFTGILEVGLLPVNVFLQILNFEVFGINIGGFASALLTISIVVIIIRFLFGGSKNDK